MAPQQRCGLRAHRTRCWCHCRRCGHRRDRSRRCVRHGAAARRARTRQHRSEASASASACIGRDAGRAAARCRSRNRHFRCATGSRRGARLVAAPRLQTVPLVGQRVLRGDLGIPMWTAALVAAGVVVLAAAVGATRRYGRVGSRPTSRMPQTPTRWRLVPLAVSIGLIAYSVTQTGQPGVRLFVSGVFAASVGVVVALPVLLGTLGAALARRDTVVGLLAGRRLIFDAERSARPLTALASLAVIVPVAASYVAVARSGAPAPVPSTISATIQHDPALSSTAVKLSSTVSSTCQVPVPASADIFKVVTIRNRSDIFRLQSLFLLP